MRNMLAAFAFVLFSIVACGSSSSSSGPLLAGYTWGGFAGFSCPPASTTDGSCGGPDCGGGCRANVPCDSAKPSCPSGTACDPKTSYCMPRACATKAECVAGELCVTKRLSKGVCATVPASAPKTCSETVTCPFPWDCTASGCALFCIDGECPGALQCGGGSCAP